MVVIPEDIKALAKRGYLPFFYSGDHTAEGKGNWPPERVKKVADNYNPEFNYAPVVLGHPEDDSPAFGRFREVQSVDSVDPQGDSSTWLVGVPDRIDPAFAQAVKDGRFGRLSAAFYTEGELPGIDGPYLRHVGFFGAGAVAKKGMPDPAIGLAGAGFKAEFHPADGGDKKFEELEFDAEELGLKEIDTEMLAMFFEKADEGAKWDFSSADYTLEQLMRASAVVDGISGNPHTAPAKGGVTKEQCHLPHHRPDGTVVWHGVSNALARLSQTNVSSEEKNRAFNHLKNHAVNDFKKEVTEQKFQEDNDFNQGGKPMFAKLLASLVSALPEDTAKSVFGELTQKLGTTPPKAEEKNPPEAGKEAEKPEPKPEPTAKAVFGEADVDAKVAEKVTAELSIINKVNEFAEMAWPRVPVVSRNSINATYEGLLRREQTPEFAEAEKNVPVQPGQPAPKRPSEEFYEGIKSMPVLFKDGAPIPPDAKGEGGNTFAEEGENIADEENERRGHPPQIAVIKKDK